MSATLTLFSGLAVRKAFDDELIPAFEAQSTHRIRPVFDPTVQLIRRIDAGERFDVLIGATGSFADPILADAVIAESITPFVRTGLGIGTAPGARSSDISTVEALTQTLLDARSVAYSRTGQSGIYFVELVERLGIADEVLARATVLEKGFTATALMDGRADLAVQQVSELMFIPETQLLGFLPDGAQHYTDFAAAIARESTVADAAREFVRYISRPAAAEAYRRSHLEPM